MAEQSDHAATSTSPPAVFAVIAGGGTAGHVLPALAVAESLEAIGYRAEQIHYMGATRGIETRMLPATPYPYSLYEVTGLQRRLDRSNLWFLPRLIKARHQAKRFLREHSVRVVISVGGYASLPAVLAARALKIPVVVISYDRRPGRSSQITARWAAACAVSFEDSSLPRAVMTGAPIRRSILDLRRARDRELARQALGVDPERFMIAVVGGSQGSQALNDATAALVDMYRSDHHVAIHHVAGERFMSAVRAACDGSEGIAYRPVGYEERMDLVYAACDVLIARGGASTVHEVAVTGTPAILVPWPEAAEDHQRLNVAWLSDVGGAVLLEESELGFLGEVVQDLRDSPSRRLSLGSAAFEMGAVHRRGALTALIESIALA
jgi:UDP-N-acetylglucosamine--N-acetylmuramyl-(pentapeptide) pyrophosphoryl-undecaprenol N-acetylglucosamine transferase